MNTNNNILLHSKREREEKNKENKKKEEEDMNYGENLDFIISGLKIKNSSIDR